MSVTKKAKAKRLSILDLCLRYKKRKGPMYEVLFDFNIDVHPIPRDEHNRYIITPELVKELDEYLGYTPE